MVPDSSRRATLQLAGTVLAGGVAGCAALGRGDDPDAGTDSYGVQVRNRLGESHGVTVTVRTYDDETVHEDEVTLDAGETTEWDELLTDDVRYLVRATLDHEHFDGRYASDRSSVKVGNEDGSREPNVVVELYEENLQGFPETIHAVRVFLPGSGG